MMAMSSSLCENVTRADKVKVVGIKHASHKNLHTQPRWKRLPVPHHGSFSRHRTDACQIIASKQDQVTDRRCRSLHIPTAHISPLKRVLYYYQGWWHTEAIPEAGVPPVRISDGEDIFESAIPSSDIIGDVQVPMVFAVLDVRLAVSCIYLQVLSL